MIVNKAVGFPSEVTYSDPYRHKFTDCMAEYLFTSLDNDGDERTGESDFGLYASRFGKRILFGDDQGFVWCDRYESVELAKQAFAEVDERYSAWLEADEADC